MITACKTLTLGNHYLVTVNWLVGGKDKVYANVSPNEKQADILIEYVAKKAFRVMLAKYINHREAAYYKIGQLSPDRVRVISTLRNTLSLIKEQSLKKHCEFYLYNINSFRYIAPGKESKYYEGIHNKLNELSIYSSSITNTNNHG